MNTQAGHGPSPPGRTISTGTAASSTSSTEGSFVIARTRRPSRRRSRTVAIRISARRRLGKRIAVVLVPLTLEHLVRVVPPLQGEKLSNLRVACLELLGRCPAVVGEEVASPAGEGVVDEPAESRRSVLETRRRVDGVDVEDHACPAVARPGEESFVVALDQADRSVDDVDPGGCE